MTPRNSVEVRGLMAPKIDTDAMLYGSPEKISIWRLITRRKEHVVVVPRSDFEEERCRIPQELKRKSWLAWLLNETVYVQEYSIPGDRWEWVLRCKARELNQLSRMDYSYKAIKKRFLSKGELPFLKRPRLPLPENRGRCDTIKLVCHITGARKLSDIIYFMVYSLIKQSERAEFKVDMDTYGVSNKTFCFGCAATCAIQEMSGVRFEVEDTYSVFQERVCSALGIRYEDEKRIEWFFNSLRLSDDYSILDLDAHPDMKITDQMMKELTNVPALTSETWKQNIGKFVKLADKWSAEGC